MRSSATSVRSTVSRRTATGALLLGLVVGGVPSAHAQADEAQPEEAQPEEAQPEEAQPEEAQPAAPAPGEAPAPEEAKAPDAPKAGDAPAAGDAPDAAGDAPAAAGDGPAPAAGDAAQAGSAATAEAASSTPVRNAAELREVDQEVARFAAEIEEYRQDVARLVEYRYNQKRAAIQRQYAQVVGELQEQERRRRDEAIVRFEEFLAKYPNNPNYTPNALFRLAELHFEKSNDVYITALEEYDRLAIDFDEGRAEDPPPEPKQDYRTTIQLFDRLITQWPEFEKVDGAYYLKGYCLLEMGEDKEALEQFLALVQKYPESRFIPETYTRIGEYYFEYNQLPEAIAAYSEVIRYPDSPFYDKALYKLAWTYYRDDQFDAAINRFRELIEFADEKAAKTGGSGSDLRSEAVQYFAISLQEEDWDGDGLPDEGAGFQRALNYLQTGKPYEADVLNALAGIYLDNAQYEEAVQAFRFILKRYPTKPENPEMHSQLIMAYERLREFEKAFAERNVLARSYLEGTPWYEANQNDQEAIAQAAELAEQALIEAATYHHTRAQELKEVAQTEGDVAAEEEAIREYRLAAVAYENYLRNYPKSDNAYELGFFYAECLYYSFRFPEAAEQYASVRDSNLGNQYRELAAFSTVLAWENAASELIQQGRLDPTPSLLNRPLDAESAAMSSGAAREGAEGGEVIEVKPAEIPDVSGALITARESYVKGDFKGVDDKSRRPKMAYKAGELYFDYQHYDKAREWFAWLMENYPQEQVTVFAANNIIESYRVVNDWEKMAEWSQRIVDAKLGTAEEREKLAAEVRTLKVGALFKKAEQLFAAKKYDEAAAEYVRLVEENPGNKYSDSALNNAAVAYEKTRRFESATNIYERLYQKYPDSQYAEDALFRVAVNSERFYDFDRAVRGYKQLVQRYDESEKRPDSLFRAALLQEQMQNYQAAAADFERYADFFPGREDTPQTYYRAALNYEKLGDTRNMNRVFEDFIRRYGNDPKQNDRVIEALAKIGKTVVDRGNERNTRAAYERIINEFNRRGMGVGTAAANHPAEASFRLVEYEFEKYKSLKLVGSIENQGRVIKDMQRRLQELERRYAEVLEYKSVEWSLAAFYRLGQIFQIFAQSLYEAPIPEEFDDEMQEIYRTQLEDLALPIEDKAVQRYEGAYDKAREFKVVNEWTKAILKALNSYKPSDYPLFKEERRMAVDTVRSAARLITPPPPPEEETELPDEEESEAAGGEAVVGEASDTDEIGDEPAAEADAIGEEEAAPEAFE
jgi:TolA-binding protein